MNSNDLVSKILAMVSEDAKIKGILDQLLGGFGTQFAVVPSEQVVQPETAISYDDLALHCSVMRRAVLCGFITPPKRRGPPDCVLNPPDKATPRVWQGCGLVLIVAGDAELHARVSSSSPPTPVYGGARMSATDIGTPTSTLSRAASLHAMADADAHDGEWYELDERPRAVEYE